MYIESSGSLVTIYTARLRNVFISYFVLLVISLCIFLALFLPLLTHGYPKTSNVLAAFSVPVFTIIGELLFLPFLTAKTSIDKATRRIFRQMWIYGFKWKSEMNYTESAGLDVHYVHAGRHGHWGVHLFDQGKKTKISTHVSRKRAAKTAEKISDLTGIRFVS